MATYACVSERPFRPVEPEQTPASAFAPTLADSFLGPQRSAIVVVQVDSLNGHFVAHGSATLYSNFAFTNPAKDAARLAQPVGRFAIVHLGTGADVTYRIKCMAENMHTVWTPRLRLQPQAIDTVVCRMTRRSPGDPPEPDFPKHLPD